ncbi:hypothetical protein LC048_24755 [Mesobacillus subterraneus]|uniref:hypothetical protein n=1 Tax=Mesobacillus subterraneus TaxID=285983 RepID=UPI001CFE5D45|nr:hypothetical protein [Mesobacillus subterraneus]WLR55429.1 hypothetical protein LC048_24755 [Mesobacillus subterraneus]
MFEDDYDEYDYAEEYEPDPYEDELNRQYNKVKNEFILSYISKPVDRLTFHLLKDIYKDLKNIPYEQSSLRNSFIKDTVGQIQNQSFKKKFLTEAFLYQFRNTNLNLNPGESLKIIYEDDTFNLSKLFYENGHYPFVMKFILETVSRAEKNKPAETYTRSKYTVDHSHDDDNEYSDVLYWEAVHDGEIVPDEYVDNNDSDFDSYDDYYSYDREDSKIYSDPERIASKLEKYIKLLEEETAFTIPMNDQVQFLEKFKKHSFTAKSFLSDLMIKKHIDNVLGELERLSEAVGLDVEISSSFDKKLNFNRKDGSRYLELTFFKEVNDKESWGSNDFSLYIDNIKKNVSTPDLEFVLSVLQTVGYDVDHRYIDFVYEVLEKDDFFGDNHIKFPSGLKIKAINHGNELRQFLEWQD